jgi:hypothetical protein
MQRDRVALLGRRHVGVQAVLVEHTRGTVRARSGVSEISKPRSARPA